MKLKKLNEIFDVRLGNKFDYNKMQKCSREEGGINFVGRSSQNKGVSGVVKRIENIPPFEAGLITVALGGTKILSSFVQQSPFYTAQNVAVLKPLISLSFNEKVYLCLCIRHNRFRYSAFGREANRTLKYMEIPDSGSFPDWINTVEYFNTKEISKPLTKDSSNIDITTIQNFFRLVPIETVFEVKYGSNLELNSLKIDSSGINFVSRSSRNNGVTAKVARIPDLEPIESGVLTVACGGSVLETFVQPEPFYSGRDLYYLKPLVNLNTFQKLFYCTIIKANRYRYSYGRQANRTLKNILIPAPDKELLEMIDVYMGGLSYSSNFK